MFGGNTAEARDARVRALIDNNINVASLKRTAPPVVEGWMTAAAAAKPVKEAAAKPVKEKEQPAVAVAPQALAFTSEPDPQSSLIGSSGPIWLY